MGEERGSGAWPQTTTGPLATRPRPGLPFARLTLADGRIESAEGLCPTLHVHQLSSDPLSFRLEPFPKAFAQAIGSGAILVTSDWLGSLIGLRSDDGGSFPF